MSYNKLCRACDALLNYIPKGLSRNWYYGICDACEKKAPVTDPHDRCVNDPR